MGPPPYSTANPPLKFTDLPSDTILETFRHVELWDIIAMSKTCKVFNVAANERSVWLQGLRRMCRENRIFMPTFPLEDMSTQELRHAATAPFRFNRRLRLNQRAPRLPARSSRVFSCAASGRHYLFLVPGGRFLIALVQSNNFTLQLWDLGYGFIPIDERSLITSMVIPPDTHLTPVMVGLEMDQFFQTTADGLGLRILLHTSNLSWPAANTVLNVHQQILTVYEIFPASAQPTFREVNRIVVHHEHTLAVRSFTRECVIYDGPDDATVMWNFDLVQDEWARWKTEETWGQIVVYDDQLIMFDTPRSQARVLISQKPQLQTRHAGLDAPMVTLVFLAKTSIDIAYAYEVLIDRQDLLATPESLPLRFIILSLRDGDDAFPTKRPHYVSKWMDYCGDDMLPSCLPLLMSEAPLPAQFARAQCISYMSTDLRLFYKDGNGSMEVATLTSTGCTSIELCAGSDELTEDRNFALCPHSGRICFADEPYGSEIRVVDFV